MSALQSLTQMRISRRAAIALAMVTTGWLALYLPVYLDFAGGPWTRPENAHGPFIIAICLATGAMALRRGGLAMAAAGECVFGLAVLTAGLFLFTIGRAGEIVLFISGSQPLVAAGIVMALFGVSGVRRLWFPLALSAYLIIWPGWAIDAATGPLKIMISDLVAQALYAAGLPVAHSGAIISAGPYELLVVRACAGLNSLIALTAVGAVYLYTVRRPSIWANLIIFAAMIPLAIGANLVRVAILVLITYYWGYDAGQSFLHEGAGLLMFALALGGVFGIDALVAALTPRAGSAR